MVAEFVVTFDADAEAGATHDNEFDVVLKEKRLATAPVEQFEYTSIVYDLFALRLFRLYDVPVKSEAARYQDPPSGKT